MNTLLTVFLKEFSEIYVGGHNLVEVADLSFDILGQGKSARHKLTDLAKARVSNLAGYKVRDHAGPPD